MLHNNLDTSRIVIVSAVHIDLHRILTVAEIFIYRTPDRESLIRLVLIDVDFSTGQSFNRGRSHIGILEHDRNHFGARHHGLLGRAFHKFNGRRRELVLHHNLARHFRIRVNARYRDRVCPCRIRKAFGNPARERVGFRLFIKVGLNAFRKVCRLGRLYVFIPVDNRFNGIACRHCLRGIVTNERKHRHNRLMRHDNLYRGRRIVIGASHIYRHNVFFILQ